MKTASTSASVVAAAGPVALPTKSSAAVSEDSDSKTFSIFKIIVAIIYES